MSQISINLVITSTAQLEALEYSLSLYSESENDRLRDEIRDAEREGHRGRLAELKRDKARADAAAALLKAIRG